MMAIVGHVLHFQPSEMGSMDFEEFLGFYYRAKELFKIKQERLENMIASLMRV